MSVSLITHQSPKMSLKQKKKVGKESSPKTKAPKKIVLPSEQLARLTILAKHTLNILKETSSHIDAIVRKETVRLDDHCHDKLPEQQRWVIETLTQMQGVSSALKAVSNHARWELFEKIEPPLSWETPAAYKKE